MGDRDDAGTWAIGGIFAKPAALDGFHAHTQNHRGADVDANHMRSLSGAGQIEVIEAVPSQPAKLWERVLYSCRSLKLSPLEAPGF